MPMLPRIMPFNDFAARGITREVIRYSKVISEEAFHTYSSRSEKPSLRRADLRVGNFFRADPIRQLPVILRDNSRSWDSNSVPA